MKYPAAPRTDLIDILHGVPVADPFRPLEADADPGTMAWVDAENALTRQVLDTPRRAQIVERLRLLHRHRRTSVPSVRGTRIFFTQNDGTKNQPILYLLDAGRAPRQLIDPNTLDAEGTTALTAFEPDDEGARVVYALSRHGSDVQELHVYDIASGTDTIDCVRWVKFAWIAWAGDGLFYTRFPQPGTVPPEQEQYFCQVWFHRLGDSQDADRLVYERPDAPEAVFEVDVTSDGGWLVITSRCGASDNAEVHAVDLMRPGEPVRALVTGFSSGWHFIDGAGRRLYFWTDANAPRGRIVQCDLDENETPPHQTTLNPSRQAMVEVVGESPDTLSLAVVGGGRFFVSYLKNASDRVRMFELDGQPAGEIDLPGLGSVVGIAGRWADERCYLTFTSFTMPPQIFACDVDVHRAVPIEQPPAAREPRGAVDPSQYVTEQVWYPSKDATPISMFLVRRSDTTIPAPVVLSGYGGFNISLTPTFDPSDVLWLESGGVVAVANLRGGGEYGEEWHRAGMLDRKQNVFDDFIAAAEYLIASGRSLPGRIAIEGGSNGGLLVAATMLQRPELFGAVVCRVPVADMLRYHLFTVGRFWIPEYGCAENPAQFEYLLRYSPYHNVRDGVSYPPTLVMTADTDDRVAPGMAKKFAARLQEALADAPPHAGPVLLRVEMRAGHGAGKPVQKQVDEQADVSEFLFRYLTGAPASEQQ